MEIKIEMDERTMWAIVSIGICTVFSLIAIFSSYH